MKRGVTASVRAAARLRGPPLPGGAVSVREAVLTLGLSTVQNVLDVLDDQVDGHCTKQETVTWATKIGFKTYKVFFGIELMQLTWLPCPFFFFFF